MPCRLRETTSWAVDIPTTLAIVAALVVYLRGFLRLRAFSPQLVASRRLLAFVAGAFALWLASGSPLSTLDASLLTFHMVQHLLLMTVAAPLVLLGAPGRA